MKDASSWKAELGEGWNSGSVLDCIANLWRWRSKRWHLPCWNYINAMKVSYRYSILRCKQWGIRGTAALNYKMIIQLKAC